MPGEYNELNYTFSLKITAYECCPLGLQPFNFHYKGHRLYFHIISRHPIDTKDPFNSIMDPFDGMTWLAHGIVLAILSVCLLIIYKLYQKFCPQNLKMKADGYFLALRLFFGLTEPDEVDFFSQQAFYSSGLKQ